MVLLQEISCRKQPELRVRLWLPATNPNQRLAFVCHIHQQEQITLVGVGRGIILLSYLNLEHLAWQLLLQLHHIVLRKLDVHKLVPFKRPLQAL